MLLNRSNRRGIAGNNTVVLSNCRDWGPFLESPGNLPGPISLVLNVFFAEYTMIYGHGSWPIVQLLTTKKWFNCSFHDKSMKLGRVTNLYKTNIF